MYKMFNMRNYIVLLMLFGSICQGYTQNQEVAIHKIETQDSILYHMSSNSIAPIDVTIVQDSLFPRIVYKDAFNIKPKDSVLGLIKMHKNMVDTLSSLSDIIQMKAYYGDVTNAKHNDDYLYALPYARGEKYEVTQTFGGKKSHKSIASKYAIDFNMKTGDKVYAAREGIVIRAVDSFKIGGRRKELQEKANNVLILHDDGTLASYAHLMFKGTVVKKGDVVKRGQHIGYSGSTGYSGGPHLHFVVREPRDISVPIYFEDYEGQILKRGKRYKRKH